MGGASSAPGVRPLLSSIGTPGGTIARRKVEPRPAKQGSAMNSPVLQPGPRLFDFDNSYSRDLEASTSAGTRRRFPRLAWSSSTAPWPKNCASTRTSSSSRPASMPWPEILFPRASPLAQAYAGHQFEPIFPQLGTAAPPARRSHRPERGAARHRLQGLRPLRFPAGDGKCALGPALREYLVGEAMAALGVPTTRTLRWSPPAKPCARTGPARSGAHPRCGQPSAHPGPSNSSPPTGAGSSQTIGRLRHRPPLSGSGGGERPYVAFLDAVRPPPGRPWWPAGSDRFHSWGHEYRQYEHFRETIDYGPAPSWRPPPIDRLQFHRYRRPLCLRPARQDRPMESRPPCRGLTTPARSRRRTGGDPGHRDTRSLPGRRCPVAESLRRQARPAADRPHRR